MIADLHCHYPMHLLPVDRDPHGPHASWLERFRDVAQAEIEGFLAHFLNNPSLTAPWRVDLDGLEQGGAKIVCSVLYWPPAEFDFAKKYGSPPLREYYQDLQHQLKFVEDNLRELDPEDKRVIVARKLSDLDDKRMVFVHCVEGGLHLGPEEAQVDERVKWLSQHGILYITLAHLFYRDVATNAPAIPKLTDSEYNRIFHQPAVGLTDLGKAAVRAMYEHKVLIDVSHMRQDALDETFALVEQLDREYDREASDYPIIATHVGMREVGPNVQAYNLTAATAQRIHARGGVIGLITAQHQLGSTTTPEDSRALVGHHLSVLRRACKGHEATAIGTDIDGFIKPTLTGLERATDFKVLEQWVREDQPNDADAILYANARRVIGKAFKGRPPPP